MKWGKPVVGQMRTKTKFLIFPKTLQDSGRVNVVTRWLEVVEIKQTYETMGRTIYGDSINFWKDLHWSDI